MNSKRVQKHITAPKKSKYEEKDYLTLDEVFDTQSEFFSKMMDIVNKNSKYPRTVVKGRELHHIIERNFSKLMKKPVDNRDNNLVSLTKIDHTLIHFYAWKCVKTEFRRGAARAVTMMRRNLICGDIGKNEFIIRLLAESNELIDADAALCKVLDKGRKSRKRKHSHTLDILDTLTGMLMTSLSNGTSVGELYTKMGIIGTTHAFKTRYLRNGLKDIQKEFKDLQLEPLVDIFTMIFGKFTKKGLHQNEVGNSTFQRNCKLYSFIIWYLSEYHMSQYDRNDTINDVIEKYNNDLDILLYEDYIDSLEDYRDMHGTWYNDGFSEIRFRINPDPEHWVLGRLQSDDTEHKKLKR